MNDEQPLHHVVGDIVITEMPRNPIDGYAHHYTIRGQDPYIHFYQHLRVKHPILANQDEPWAESLNMDSLRQPVTVIVQTTPDRRDIYNLHDYLENYDAYETVEQSALISWYFRQPECCLRQILSKNADASFDRITRIITPEALTLLPEILSSPELVITNRDEALQNMELFQLWDYYGYFGPRCDNYQDCIGCPRANNERLKILDEPLHRLLFFSYDGEDLEQPMIINNQIMIEIDSARHLTITITALSHA